MEYTTKTGKKFDIEPIEPYELKDTFIVRLDILTDRLDTLIDEHTNAYEELCTSGNENDSLVTKGWVEALQYIKKMYNESI